MNSATATTYGIARDGAVGDGNMISDGGVNSATIITCGIAGDRAVGDCDLTEEIKSIGVGMNSATITICSVVQDGAVGDGDIVSGNSATITIRSIA